MSNSLAIAAVTKTLRNLIAKGIADELGSGSVTARPPDKARDNGDSGNQINIFLYQILPNAAWRNQDLTNRVKPGETGQAPLALNLYYLITAYGQDNDDILSHRLLGAAMRVLHDRCILHPIEIKDALAESDLQNQIERVRINPVTLSLEELSKLWSCFQTQYRISAAYEVSVILIESDRPVKAPLPVLSYSFGEKGAIADSNLIPPFPTLNLLQLPNPELSVRLGELFTIQGHHLDGSSVRVLLQHLRWKNSIELPPELILNKTATEIKVQLPKDTNSLAGNVNNNWLAGLYTVKVVVTQNARVRTSNELVFALAPEINNPSILQDISKGMKTLNLECHPHVVPEQKVSLLLGDRELIPQPVLEKTDTLVFDITAIVNDQYFIRLRVDGVDSLLLVDRAGKTPVFDQNQKINIP